MTSKLIMTTYFKIIFLVSLIDLYSVFQFKALAFQAEKKLDAPIEKVETMKEKKPKRNAMVIAFDETGQMIRFPKQMIKRSQVVVFKVRVSRSAFAAQINMLFTKLDSVYDFFINKQENQLVLWALFKNDSATLTAWLTELQKYLSIRQILGNGKEYDLWRYARSDTNTLYTFVDPIIYTPLPQYIHNLLFEQFKIRTYDMAFAINSEIQLKPDFRNKKPDKNDCYWWYSEPILLDTLLGTHCSDCASNLKFSLTTQDAWKVTMLDWYNKQFDGVNREPTFLQKRGKPVLKEKLEYLLAANDQLAKAEEDKEDNVAAIIDRVSVFSNEFMDDGQPRDSLKFPQFNTTGFTFINLLKPPDKSTPSFDMQKYLAAVRLTKSWLIYWLWYNNGFLVVDPLPVLRTPPANTKKETIKSATRILLRYQQQKNFLDSVRVHVQDSIANFNLFKRVQDSTDIVGHLIDSVNHIIDSLSKSIREDSVAKVRADNLTKQIGITGLQSYVGQLPIYGYKKWYQGRAFLPDKLTVQKQFSYSASQQTISSVYRNQWQKTTSTEIPENETAILVVHNIPKNSRVGLTQTLTGFNDLEEFTVLFQKLLKGLDSTGLFQLALPPGLSGFSNFLQNIVKSTSESKAKAAAATVAGKALSQASAVDAMTFNYLQTSAQRSPTAYDPNISVATSISKRIDTSGGYLTKIYPTPDSTAPYQVNIMLTIDSVKAKSVIKVGALRRFQVTAGFAVVNNPVEQISIDTAGAGFRTSSSSNNSSVIAGFKIYPFKTYLRDGALVPRYPLRRLSAVVAFSIPKPLNNFYFGGGYDLVPGFTFTMGLNVYKQNYYEVENGRITKTATRYAKGGTYYGVTVNPIILIQFVKLFFN